MRMRRGFRRFLACLLIVTMTATCPIQALASAPWGNENQSMVVKGAKEEAEKQRREASPLYARLVQSNGGSKEPWNRVTDEGDDWAEEYKMKVEKEGLMSALDAVKDAAENKIKHLWRGTSKYQGTKAGLQNVATAIDSFGSALGVVDALTQIKQVLELQGVTVEEQLMELTILTAEFGIAAFSVIGMSIGFPYGMILSLVLDLLLDMIRRGFFDDLLLSNHLLDQDAFDRQRYKLPDGTNVYKPNIYIYSQEEREVAVTFEEPRLLTATIPEYGDGWKVTVHEDGRLTDDSGLTYDYLFYESITEPSIFQTQAGWRISADTRKAQFEEILYDLGFSHQECADLTEFWTEKLEQDVDYIMYPQETRLVDLAMPMAIEEAPKSTERIWFVFVEDDGRQAEVPEGYELSRGGQDCPYYVIEWGGLIKN